MFSRRDDGMRLCQKVIKHEIKIEIEVECHNQSVKIGAIAGSCDRV
jgi:hypothetical protein